MYYITRRIYLSYYNSTIELQDTKALSIMACTDVIAILRMYGGLNSDYWLVPA